MKIVYQKECIDKMARFATVSREGLNDLVADKDSPSTKKQTDVSLKSQTSRTLFSKWFTPRENFNESYENLRLLALKVVVGNFIFPS